MNANEAQEKDWHVVMISVAGNSIRFDLSDNIIVEKPAPDTYLMIAGSGGPASVERKNPSMGPRVEI